MRKTKLLTQKRRHLTRYAKAETRNRGSQQSHRKPNLAKLRKTKLLTQKRRHLTRYAKAGTRNRGSQQNHRKNKSGKVEKNKTTDTEAKAPKQPRKPKNVTRSIEASYAKLTKLEKRKPKTPFEAKNECIIPQKVSTISLITRLRLEVTDFLKNLFF